ncbi:MAG: DNA/RNA non-specific endonuclease [Bacteroidales bacterium]|nr:DNA/RNA non-specific endonuclease [Bacteroidales bacterium]
MRTICIDLLTFFLAIGCIPARPKTGAQIPVKQVETENWAPIVAKSSSIETVIEYNGFTVSYNSQNRIPTWVFYELTAEKTNGPYSRKGKDFLQDINAQVPQSDAYDYRGSGWSRGHMAPAGDFKWDDRAMWDTFYYTNCCPQDEKLNNGSWNVLENKVRTWAKQFGRVFVVTGPIVGQNQGGKIGAHQITVPDAFFKALLVYKDELYHGIAFVMFNTPATQRLPESCLSINELEKVSGLDFFPSLDDSIEEIVENEMDLRFWNIR